MSEKIYTKALRSDETKQPSIHAISWIASLRSQRRASLVSCFIFALLAAMLLTFAGCQLAREAVPPEEARMVGVFITAEPLDLNNNSFEGMVVPIRRGRADFSALLQPGRLYAQWDEAASEFRFPDIEGIPFFTAVRPDDVNFFVMGAGIVSGGNHVHIGDNYTHIEMEGTIYIVPGAQVMSIVHMNPVYQTACGRVFITSGDSAFSAHGTDSEGRIFSSSKAHTASTTENGAESTHSISVTVNLHSMFAPEKIVLLQMDEYSRVVMRTAFAPDEMPETLYMQHDTAYVIVETHRDRPHAHERVTRGLVVQDRHERQRISTFMAREDGVLVKTWTEIVWHSILQQ